MAPILSRPERTSVSPDSARWRPSLPINPIVGTRAGKASAALAFVCVLVHIPLLWMHWADFPGTSLMMLVAACACVPCSRHLWRRPTKQVWAWAGVSAGAMLTLHLTMLLPMARTSEMTSTNHGSHHHGAVPTVVTAPGPSHEHVGTPIFYIASGLAVFQILLGVAMVIAAERRTHPTIQPPTLSG